MYNLFCDFLLIFFEFFGGLECVVHSFAYVAHFVFLRAAVESRCATNLATYLPNLAPHLPNLATHLPHLATQLCNLATHLPHLATYLPKLATHLPILATQLSYPRISLI